MFRHTRHFCTARLTQVQNELFQGDKFIGAAWHIRFDVQKFKNLDSE